MTRQFEKPDYEAMLHKTIQVGEALPEEHLARFVVKVISLLDLESIYGQVCEGRGQSDSARGAAGIVGVWLCERGFQFTQDRTSDVREFSLSICGWGTASRP